jgi:hypothetical protein
MLAYVFWHRPYPHVDAARYEHGLVRFHAILAQQAPPGLHESGSFRIEPVPWLGDRPGYEDWHLIQGSWAMDPLNAYAVAGTAQAHHDTVAAEMETGAGGLYALAGGEPVLPSDSRVTWLTRPRGIKWQPVLDALRSQVKNATVWRRQMVLGPGLEFAVVTPNGAQVPTPDGWQARSVKRVRLTHTA